MRLSEMVRRIWKYVVQKQSSFTVRLFVYCGVLYLSSFFVGIIVLALGEETLVRGRDTGGVAIKIFITLGVDIVILTLFYKEIRHIFYRFLTAVLLCLFAIPLGVFVYLWTIPALHLQAYLPMIDYIDFMSGFTGVDIGISFWVNLIIIFEVIVCSFIVRKNSCTS